MVTVISSTHRKNSYSSKVAAVYLGMLESKGIQCQLLNLSTLPHDFAFTQIEDIFSEDFDKIIRQYIVSVEKYIFIIPEYNGGFPGILKAFVDAVPPKHFRGKKTALTGISSGKAGALKAMDDFTGILHYLQAEVLSDKPKFTDIENAFNEKNEFISDDINVRIHKQLDKFLSF